MGNKLHPMSAGRGVISQSRGGGKHYYVSFERDPRVVAEIELPLSITAAIKLKIKLPPYFQAIKTAELLYLSGTSPAQAEITGRRSDGRTLDSVVVRPERLSVSQSVTQQWLVEQVKKELVLPPGALCGTDSSV